VKLPILLASALLVPALATAQNVLEEKKQKPAAEKPAAKAAPAKPAAKGGALATVNGVAVPQSRADLLVQEQVQRGQPDNEQLRNAIRDELINREIVAQEAQRAGVTKLPDVQAQIDWARQSIMVNAYLREYARKNPVTEAEIQKEYDTAKSRHGDKEYKARHILVETEDQAKGLIAELKKGAKFEDLASKNSKDPGSAARGGDLDWNVPGTFDKQFSDAMVKLEKGKITDAPVKTRFGFHIIQLDDVRPAKFAALGEVRQDRRAGEGAKGESEGGVKESLWLASTARRPSRKSVR
jgi:peptidyl-prolyl cis-trans isomerase C